MIYSKYLIKDTDQFCAVDFPKIVDDIAIIIGALAATPALQNSEILLSFTRDHSLKLDWVTAHPALAELISSKALPTSNLEALFASCSQNPSFRRQLEEYITTRLRHADGS